MSELDSGTKDKVIKQVEFYFSNSNLYHDIHLRRIIDKNDDGWVDLDKVCAFRRMQTLLQLNVANSTSVPNYIVQKVAETLKDSKVVQINEEKTQIRRRSKIPSIDELEESINQRSLFVEPFPFDVTVEDLTHFFAQHGTVLLVVLRRAGKEHKFKGNIFVEFSSPEEAAKIQEMQLVFQGANLRMKMKNEWWQQKKLSKEQDEDYFDSEAEEREDLAGIEVEKGCFLNFTFDEKNENEEEQNIESVELDMIKETFGGKQKVGWVQWEPGQKTGILRFRSEEALKESLKDHEIEDKEGQMKISGLSASIRILEGEEEKKQIQKTKEQIHESIQRKSNTQGRDGGKKRKGGFRGRGRNKR